MMHQNEENFPNVVIRIPLRHIKIAQTLLIANTQCETHSILTAWACNVLSVILIWEDTQELSWEVMYKIGYQTLIGVSSVSKGQITSSFSSLFFPVKYT